MVTENTVLRFILDSNSASCYLHLLYELFVNPDPIYVLDSLNAFRQIKVLVKPSHISKSLVFIFIKEMRLCAHSMHCKKGLACPFLHLCPEFVSGTCNRSNCKFSHDFHDEHNLSVVKKCGIDDICHDDGVLLELVRCCTPIICLQHNGPGCADPELCLKLHVCDEYFCSRCQSSDSDCPYGHDLYSEHNMELLTLFKLNHWRTRNENLLHKMILKAGSSYVKGQVQRSKAKKNMGEFAGRGHINNKKTPNKRPTKLSAGLPRNPVNECGVEIRPGKSQTVAGGFTQFREKQDGGEFPSFTNALIMSETNGGRVNVMAGVDPGNNKTHDKVKSCPVAQECKDVRHFCEEFESHECFGNSICTNRHVIEKFCWRVQLSRKWVSLDSLEEQCEIENAFCNPDCSKFLTTFLSNQITIDFETMTCLLGAVQRLSTPSYVTCRDKTDATQWRWYWREGDSCSRLWIAYEDDKPPFQDVLESKYLHDKTQSCWFETHNSQQYIVDFVEMKQTNLTTGFKRDVRRRPADTWNSENRRGYRSNFDPSKLPINEEWVPMNTEIDTSIDLIPITRDQGKRKYLYWKVETEFFKTMSRANFRIERMYYIQNLHLWKNYKERKSRIESSNSQPNQFERQLFHGTVDETTVRCICHQNFDHRMHGVHGTAYGKGAYFATTANYSHSYTKPCGRDGNRKMFFARVLVGNSTLGVTDYKRPPPLDPRKPHGALYDTCVNDVSNPSIYVVFDDEHCYPEFLIEYKELQMLAAAPAPPPVPARRIIPTIQASGLQSSQPLTPSAPQISSVPYIGSGGSTQFSHSSSAAASASSPSQQYPQVYPTLAATSSASMSNRPVYGGSSQPYSPSSAARPKPQTATKEEKKCVIM